jgi:hypothetical protein
MKNKVLSVFTFPAVTHNFLRNLLSCTLIWQYPRAQNTVTETTKAVPFSPRIDILALYCVTCRISHDGSLCSSCKRPYIVLTTGQLWRPAWPLCAQLVPHVPQLELTPALQFTLPHATSSVFRTTSLSLACLLWRRCQPYLNFETI